MKRKVYALMNRTEEDEEVLLNIFSSVEDMMEWVRNRNKNSKKNFGYDPEYPCVYYFYDNRPGVTYYAHHVQIFELEFNNENN